MFLFPHLKDWFFYFNQKTWIKTSCKTSKELSFCLKYLDEDKKADFSWNLAEKSEFHSNLEAKKQVPQDALLTQIVSEQFPLIQRAVQSYEK